MSQTTDATTTAAATAEQPTKPEGPMARATSRSKWEWPRIAALTHRLSGLAIALFLPLHFLALGLALDETAFGNFIAWTDNTFVKVSEVGLISALALHFTGGLRLLAIEFFSLDARDAYYIALAVGFAAALSLLFLMGVFS